MKKYLGNASLGALLALGLVLGASVAGAAPMPVTGWVGVFDGDDPDNLVFLNNSEGSDSPSLTDAHKESIAADIGANTLTNDGDFIKLTGSVSFTTDYVQNGQFRWGLFDRATLTVDPVVNPSGYVGYWAPAPVTSTSGQDLMANDGDGGTPFSGGTGLGLPSGSSILGVGNFVAAGTELSFILTIVKNGATADVSASISDGLGGYFVNWSVIGTAASPGSLTYDSVSFHMGGGMVPGRADYSNIEVTTGNIPEPTSILLLGLGSLLIGGVSRRRS